MLLFKKFLQAANFLREILVAFSKDARFQETHKRVKPNSAVQFRPVLNLFTLSVHLQMQTGDFKHTCKCFKMSLMIVQDGVWIYLCIPGFLIIPRHLWNGVVLQADKKLPLLFFLATYVWFFLKALLFLKEVFPLLNDQHRSGRSSTKHICDKLKSRINNGSWEANKRLVKLTHGNMDDSTSICPIQCNKWSSTQRLFLKGTQLASKAHVPV